MLYVSRTDMYPVCPTCLHLHIMLDGTVYIIYGGKIVDALCIQHDIRYNHGSCFYQYIIMISSHGIIKITEYKWTTQID